MEASKCPKCGEEPQYIEHIEKWYCYGCNTYVEDEDHVCCHEEMKTEGGPEVQQTAHAPEAEDDKLVCKSCGAELEDLKEGRLYCFMCETYQDEAGDPKPEPKPEQKPVEERAHVVNEAQQLLETALPQATMPVAEPAVEIHTPEPVVDRAEEPIVPATSVPVPIPVHEQHITIEMCPSCGKPLKWIEKYERSYCYNCKKYAPKDGAEEPPAPAKKTCPSCKGELKFIEKYSEWYCYKCKKYPLKPEKKAEAAKPQALVCPSCKGQVRWIDKYSRYYCAKCEQYAPKGFGGVSADAGEKKTCPTCHDAMKFVPEYNEWYCYKCKKYSLRPSKPVLLF